MSIPAPICDVPVGFDECRAEVNDLISRDISKSKISLSLSYIFSFVETTFRFTCGHLISLVNFALRCNALYKRNRITRDRHFPYLSLSLTEAIFPRASKRAITIHFILRVFRIAQRCVYAAQASRPVWTNSVWTEFWNCVFKSDRTSSSINPLDS